jgi:predicted nicotinamide N-methyase
MESDRHGPLSPGPAAFIRANLPLEAVPTVPEIRLHQAAPSSGLHRLASKAPPYWAWPWAGGLALARFILDRPETVAGRRVLDLGAGSGLVAIAAAKAGAEAVTAAEIDANARAALGLNAGANGVAVDVVETDLIGGAPPDVDVMLVGDLFYEARLARRVSRFLDRCLDAGTEILVGDVGRAHLPDERLRPLARYGVPDFGETKPGMVFSFEARSAFRSDEPAFAPPQVVNG